MYVIGTVESNCDWSACNYVDAITVGMMQWYGSRARSLLERGRTADPDGWNTFASAAPTLAQQVQANDINWTARYLSTAEGNAWKTWAQRDENHAFQEAQWEADWDGYQSTMTNFGFPDRNVKERIMWACAYHQSPAQAQRVLASCSATATLELIYTTILADDVLGQYRNRYTTAYNLLKSWDGTSAPPDFGQTSEPSDTPGGDRPGVDGKPASTAWIQLQGDNLIYRSGDSIAIFYEKLCTDMDVQNFRIYPAGRRPDWRRFQFRQQQRGRGTCRGMAAGTRRQIRILAGRGAIRPRFERVRRLLQCMLASVSGRAGHRRGHMDRPDGKQGHPRLRQLRHIGVGCYRQGTSSRPTIAGLGRVYSGMGPCGNVHRRFQGRNIIARWTGKRAESVHRVG